MGGGQMPPGGGQMPPGGGQMPPGGGPPGPGQAGYPQQQPPTQQYQPQYQASQSGGGVADVAQTVQRAVRTPETKPFFLTSEFLVWLLTVIAVLVAAAVTKRGTGGADVLDAGLAWTLVTVIGFGYIISRGISKAGTKYRGENNRGGPGGY
jgi:hypothetical protein